MKPSTPAANIIIATLYLIIIIAIGYVAKLVFKNKTHATKSKPPKYSSANIAKGLTNPLMQENIHPLETIIKSLVFKYNVVGTFLNENKFYLLKQIFIIGILCVACVRINDITLWPIALAILFSIVFFIMMELFKIPFVLNISPKIQTQRQIAKNPTLEHIQIQPNFPIGLQDRHNKQKQVVKQTNKHTHSFKFVLFIGCILFVTLILISQTMFSIYNSVSNLGALNIGSVLIVILIDQLAIRPALASGIVFFVKIIIHQFENDSTNSVQNVQQIKFNKLKIFQFALLRNLCDDLLIQQMNNIHLQNGEPSERSMGVSPTKKKTFSPSKVPKAPNPVAEQQTLMHLQKIDMSHQQEKVKLEQIEEKVQEIEEVRSPIKQIQAQILKHESILFTSAQKDMFRQEAEHENDQHQINKSVTLDNINKIKINSNQFFTIQRLPKDINQEDDEEKMEEEDGIVLMETEFNVGKNKARLEKSNTTDINFSPMKKRVINSRRNTKRRQLIITGSSPYLEYLPDMMKKQRLQRKNHMTPCQPQIPTTTSRKIL